MSVGYTLPTKLVNLTLNMSEKAEDRLQRWLPTIIAALGIIGTLLFTSREYGRLEQQVAFHTVAIEKTVTNAEFISNRDAQQREMQAITRQLEIINEKLDRVLVHK